MPTLVRFSEICPGLFRPLWVTNTLMMWTMWQMPRHHLLYKGVVDDYITERKAKVRTDSLSWFTTELRKLSNKRFKFLKEWQKTKDLQKHIQQYKKARNFTKKNSKQQKQITGKMNLKRVLIRQSSEK